MRYGMSLAAVVCLYALADGSVTLAETMPLGAEFQINAYTSDAQSRPSVDMKADGSFVVVWESTGQDGSAAGVFARRFDGAGVGLGAELQVNTYTADGQLNAAVATFGGGFVVAWESSVRTARPPACSRAGSAPSGAALGPELQVNVYTTGRSAPPWWPWTADGDFVVAWQSDEPGRLGLRRLRPAFNAAGVALGGEFQVNAHTLGAAVAPGGGDGWRRRLRRRLAELGQDGFGFGVFARRFDAAGGGFGGEFQVNGSTVLQPELPGGGRGRRRRVRRLVVEHRPATRLRHLRPALRRRGRRPRRRVPGQRLHRRAARTSPRSTWRATAAS